MNTTRVLTAALAVLLTLTVLVSPAVAQEGEMTTTETMGDGSMNTTMNGSMNESMNETMQDGSMNETMTEESMTDATETESDGTASSGAGPGFTAGLALVALVGVALLGARRRT